MRHVLTEYGQEVSRALRNAEEGARFEALIEASFAESCFRPATVSAWLTFYVRALSDPEAARLLRIYQGRLRSNLIHALRGRSAAPERLAAHLGALIDGVYLRAGLTGQGAPDAAAEVLRSARAMIALEAERGRA
jgi:TetR/AcrR family transcriptional repressor of bet genes